eukprot:TRINITY_DN13607_c0_g1_i1.p1 TRINITY_DN13607_c0_g1~~TRINITY_DN13607_c0_g1_i1.p1  ORF type:complete len:208 (+),score=40.53 TRINITY_DN13607_c0_g1_i1:63-686(+)
MSLVLLFLLAVVLSGANGQPVKPPQWPSEFSLSLPPFLRFSYSFSQQAYELFINTLSPATWQSVGVSGTLLFDCSTSMRATVYSPYDDDFTQCLYGKSSIMPGCARDMFPVFWKDVALFGKTVLPSGQAVMVWNVTINEPAWPALTLSGYEAYKLYVETYHDDPLQRTPVGLTQDDLSIWYFDWTPSFNQTIVVPPTNCNPVVKLSL